jgi:uncharacterized glyoxalase superfamily protein PhnB
MPRDDARDHARNDGRDDGAHDDEEHDVEDELDALRQLRPDRLQPDDAGDPARLAAVKDSFLTGIGQRPPEAPSFRTPDVYPRLAYRDVLAALDHLTGVFGFVEVREARRQHGDHHLCWVRTGTGVVMLGPPNTDIHGIETPRATGIATSMMIVYVHDVDAHYARARARGADITMELADAFFGERRYEAADPEGHRWHFAERFADIESRVGRRSDAEERDGHDELDRSNDATSRGRTIARPIGSPSAGPRPDDGRDIGGSGGHA